MATPKKKSPAKVTTSNKTVVPVKPATAKSAPTKTTSQAAKPSKPAPAAKPKDKWAAKAAPKATPKAAGKTVSKPAPKAAPKATSITPGKTVSKPVDKTPAKAAIKAPQVSQQKSKPVTKPVPKSSATPPKPAPLDALAGTQDARPSAISPRPSSLTKSGPLITKKPLIAQSGVPGSPPRGKMVPRQFLVDLGLAIKASVADVAREIRGREILHTTVSGDSTFGIDAIAEKALLTYLKAERMPVAYYSEDAGYSTYSNAQPTSLLVVDPIDGTRAAKSGFEGCVVAIAATRVIERPVMADIDSACVVEILGNRVFYAERGNGVRMYADGHARRPKLSTNVDLEQLTWAMTVPARPAELIFQAAGRLIDVSSLKGGFFACNSTSHSLTRLVTGQLDAMVDIGYRYMRDIPDLVRDQFINAGRGHIIGVAPYDMAAALLIAQEAGCIVTDAYGNSFDPVLVLDSTSSNHQSIIAASNPQLHEKLLRYFDTRIKQIEGALTKHAQTQGART